MGMIQVFSVYQFFFMLFFCKFFLAYFSFLPKTERGLRCTSDVRIKLSGFGIFHSRRNVLIQISFVVFVWMRSILKLIDFQLFTYRVVKEAYLHCK